MLIGVIGGLLALTALGAAVGAAGAFGQPVLIAGEVVVIPVLGAFYTVGTYALQACVYAELKGGKGELGDIQIATVFS